VPLSVDHDEIRTPPPPRRGWSPAALAGAVVLHGLVVVIGVAVGAWSRPGEPERGALVIEIVELPRGDGDAGAREASSPTLEQALAAPESPPQVDADAVAPPVTVETSQPPPPVETAELTTPLESQMRPPPEADAISIAPPESPPAPKPVSPTVEPPRPTQVATPTPPKSEPPKQVAKAAPPKAPPAPPSALRPASAAAAAPPAPANPPTALGQDRGGETAGAGSAHETPGASAGSPQPGLMTHPGYARPPTPAQYPPVAIDRNLQGTVLVRALLRSGGQPDEVRVHRSSGYDLLDRAALAAVRTWEFKPARAGGQVVAAWVEVPVSFRLR
jgi:protein TonB